MNIILKRSSILAVTVLLVWCGVPAFAQTIHVVGGTAGVYGYSGDGGPALAAQLGYLQGIAADAAGNHFIVDGVNNVVRRVDAGGIITAFAGNGGVGYSGDGGPAVDAELNYPLGVAADAAGNVFIVDAGNIVVRRVDVTSGIITTVAGNGNSGFSGDGGSAVDAELYDPSRVAVYGDSLFIVDQWNSRIRRVDLSTGIIETVAGDDSGIFHGDGGPAVLAGFSYIIDLAVDGSGNLYIIDQNSGLMDMPFLVRRVDAVTGIITTVAGGGDECPMDVVEDPTRVSLGGMYVYSACLAADAGGDVYVGHGCIVYRIEGGSAPMVRCAGRLPCGFSGDGGPALEAQLGSDFESTGMLPLSGLAVAPGGALYIADQGSALVWRVDGAGSILPPTPTPTSTPAPSDPGPGLSISKSVEPASARPGDTLTFCVTLGSPPANPQVDIVWLIDRTGSMGMAIDGIRGNVVDFTNQLGSTGIDYRLGLVTFVDDPPTPLDNYGFASFDGEFQSWINGIVIEGGGDTPENDLEAVLEADSMPWRAGASRVMILVTDAPMHIAGGLGTHTIPEVLAVLAVSGTVVHVISNRMCELGAQDPAGLASGTGGLWFPQESSDWSELLEKLAQSVAAFTGVVLRDPLSSVLDPLPGSYPGATWSGGELTWDLGVVNRGVTVTHCFSSVVKGPFDPQLTNSACVTADGRSEVCSGPVTVSALSTNTPTHTTTPTITPTPTGTPTVTPSGTPTSTATVTWTNTHTLTPTITWTSTETPTLTMTGTPTNTHSPTPSTDLHVWPIPFIPGLAVRGTLKFAILPEGAQVSLFSVSGEKVMEATEKNRRVEWDGRNLKGRTCSPGVYYYIVRSGGGILLKGKVILSGL